MDSGVIFLYGANVVKHFGMCLQICNKKFIVCKARKVFMCKVTKLTEFVSKSNK